MCDCVRMVRRAFRQLDDNANGFITAGELAQRMKVSMHPAVLAGTKTPKQVLRHTMRVFDVTGDGVITAADLRACYTCSAHPKVISGEITEDEAFLEFLKLLVVRVVGLFLEEWCALLGAPNVGAAPRQYGGSTRPFSLPVSCFMRALGA